MHAIHNAGIQLLATAQNNVALAFIVAGFVAPAVTGQLAYVTWDQVVTWLIVPAIVAIVIRAADSESLKGVLPYSTRHTCPKRRARTPRAARLPTRPEKQLRAHVTEPTAGSPVNPRRGRRIPASQPGEAPLRDPGGASSFATHAV